MKTSLHQAHHIPGHPSLQAVLTDAIHFWEPRRIVYNAALAAVVLACVATIGWTRIRGNVGFEDALAVLVLAVLANVCYCAAYLLDVPAQFSAYRDTWRRRRWLLWLGGTLFGMALTWYWVADEIFPASVR
ncbi:MAG: hypothetical protein EPN40_02745 [Rhodanobacteraceae bacterium]|nr:MAG: hypothetical protein EPN40_02745 [Rhodanobacteraceae bacterium]